MFCILARLGPSAISYFASQAMPIGIWCCTLSLRQVALAIQLVHLGIRELRSASSTFLPLTVFKD